LIADFYFRNYSRFKTILCRGCFICLYIFLSILIKTNVLELISEEKINNI